MRGIGIAMRVLCFLGGGVMVAQATLTRLAVVRLHAAQPIYGVRRGRTRFQQVSGAWFGAEAMMTQGRGLYPVVRMAGPAGIKPGHSTNFERPI